jgi:peptidoglycan hydrolase-like protein with peptidoglycan-binding domain
MRTRAPLCAFLAAATGLLPAVPATAASYGSRTLREGSSGSDVTKLQRYLSSAGFRTTADGAFGPRTAKSVRAFEDANEMRVNGVVPPRDAAAIQRAAEKAAEKAPEEPVADPERATITSDGLAVAPESAPEEVKQVIEAGNEIAHHPYKYGGGHGKWNDSGYDCSGSVSYALHGAGLVKRARSSGDYMTWGRAGKGDWITIYAHGGHMYMIVAGIRFDTSGAKENGGSRWHKSKRAWGSGYTVRHPAGL